MTARNPRPHQVIARSGAPRFRGRGLALALALLAGAALSPARAQTLGGLAQRSAATTTPAPAPSHETVVEAPDSPRASARAFVELTTRKGDFKSAARYLQLPPNEEARGLELTRRLSAVIERRFEITLDALSPLPEGNTDDGLPSGVDLVGRIPDGRGGEDPVFIVRTRDDGGGYWAFSRQTVSRIDGWYDALPDRWVRDWMPQRLQRFGPFGLMWWQWLAVPVIAAVALALGRLLGGIARAFLSRLTRQTRTQWDDRLLDRVSPALTLLFGVVVMAALLSRLALIPWAERFARAVLGVIAAGGICWAAWRSVDVWALFLAARPGVTENPSARSLLALLRNFAKAFVVLAGALAILALLGYPVTTVLAGLGIGGVALAFGAQKTVENLFGSVALAVDQPFRLGDFVRIDDFVGNVERIGMRSTQVRTLDRTLISIPNGMLSEKRIEDYAARDRIRLSCTVGVVYGTSEERMKRILAGMEKVLRDHPKIWPDTVVVRFVRFGASSLDIEVMAWFQTTDYNVFRDCQQDVLLGFMRVVESEGSSFAFPTQTVHLVRDDAAAGPRS